MTIRDTISDRTHRNAGSYPTRRAPTGRHYCHTVFAPRVAGTDGRAGLMTDVPSRALTSCNVDPAKQGQVLGLNNATGALARFAGPLCAGLSFAHMRINAPFVIAAMVVAPAILLALSAVGHHTSSPRPSLSRP